MSQEPEQDNTSPLTDELVQLIATWHSTRCLQNMVINISIDTEESVIATFSHHQLMTMEEAFKKLMKDGTLNDVPTTIN